MKTINLPGGQQLTLKKYNELPATDYAGGSDSTPIAKGEGLFKITTTDLLAPVATGVGEAMFDTDPADTPTITRYNTPQGAGTYDNFSADSIGTPLVITAGEVDGRRAQIYKVPGEDYWLVDSYAVPGGVTPDQGVTYEELAEPASTNILNPADVTDDVYINAAGAAVASAGGSFSTTGFISWGEATQIISAYNGVEKMIFSAAQYNGSNVFVSGTYQGSDNIDTPINKHSASTTTKVRLTFRRTAGATQVNQINYGGTVLAYEPYYPASVKKVGNADAEGNAATFNLNPNDPAFLEKAVSFEDVEIPASTNILNPANVTADVRVNSAGALVPTTPVGSFSTIAITWGSNTQITFGKNGVAGTVFSVAQFNSGGAFIAGTFQGSDNVTAPVNKNGSSTTVLITYRVANIDQFNFGASILDYEPYYPASSRKVGNKNGLGEDVTFPPNPKAPIFQEIPKKDELNDSLEQTVGGYRFYKYITVKLDGTGDFNNLHDALSDITDASASQKYAVLLYDDIFAYNTTDYDLVSGMTYYALGLVPANVALIGMNGVRRIYAELPTNLAASVYPLYETLHLDASGELHNIDVIAKNIRYAIHFERTNAEINWNASPRIYNSKATHLGCLDVPSGNRWAAPDAFGCGFTSGVDMILSGVIITGARHGFRSHSNTVDTMPTSIHFTDCILTTALLDGYAAWIDNSPTTRQIRNITIQNSQVQGVFYLFTAISSDAPSMNKVVPSARVVGSGNNAFRFYNNQTAGRVLMVKSNTTGNTSVVTLVQDDAQLFGTLTRVDGTLGLSGTLYGDHELVESGTADRRNKIGHRLGNCSVTPKYLILNIDGTNRTVTFNQNYSDGNYATDPLINADTILAAINSQLSGYAVASYFQVNLEYFPELSDVLFLKGNSSATAFIPRSRFVKFVGNSQCRICLADEIPDGMAIDDIPVSSELMKFGRVIKNTIVSNTGRFAPSTSGSFASGDKFKVNASGQLVVDATAKSSFAEAVSSTQILIK